MSAHTFCASRDGPRKSGLLRTVPTNTKVFGAVYDSGGKTDLRKGCLESKKKSGGNYTFSGIIELKFGKKMP